MIEEHNLFCCRKCGSNNVKRNGYNASKSRLYHCFDCNFRGVMYPKVKYTEEKKEQILNTYQERASMRGIQRIFGTSPTTLAKWLKKKPSKA